MNVVIISSLRTAYSCKHLQVALETPSIYEKPFILVHTLSIRAADYEDCNTQTKNSYIPTNYTNKLHFYLNGASQTNKDM